MFAKTRVEIFNIELTSTQRFDAQTAKKTLAMRFRVEIDAIVGRRVANSGKLPNKLLFLIHRMRNDAISWRAPTRLSLPDGILQR